MIIFRSKQIAYGVIGNFLEFYNFLSFVYFVPMIGATMFPADGRISGVFGTILTFGIGFVFRPLGALVLGNYGRRNGVSKTLMISFALMCFGSLMICCTPSYARIGLLAPCLILTARIIQGFSEGGEVGPASDYLFSLGKAEERGLLVALLSITQSLAELAASTVGLILALIMSKEVLFTWGWRVPFALGLVLLPVGIMLRRGKFGDMPPQDRKPAQHDTLSPMDYVLLFLAISYGSVAAYIRSFNVTYAISILNQPSARIMLFITISTIVNIIGIWCGGMALRRLRPILLLFGAGSVYIGAAIPLYMWCASARTPLSLFLLCCIPAFVGGLMQASNYLITLRALPDRVRGHVFGIVYSLAVTFCGVATQPVAMWLISSLHDPVAPAYILISAIPVGVMSLFVLSRKDRTTAMPETRI
ncbi:MFS transporter [Komagataeibacter xylinus]|uniref:MFS transporter n=1 Tax=Komagataeibacter xylinus TaxID=28448 RepID=UPI001330FAA2|nr:MFS transporter [Komagataeibacter xylinus]